MQISNQIFGQLPTGEEILQFSLINDNGLVVKIINYGGIITAIEMADKNGEVENIVCGFERLEDYLSEQYLQDYPYFGAIIGRCANRIDNGYLPLEGNNYQLALNLSNTHLHGGTIGFDKKTWGFEIIKAADQISIKLSYDSPHGEENYPGNLGVSCLYTLNNNNELSLDFYAKTDRTTVVNLTNHTYFNLSGGRENILNHELQLNSLQITETNDALIPTGKIISVKDTALDFTSFKSIQRDIEKLSSGYDDNFVLDTKKSELKYAACLRESTSGRQIKVHTTQPGIQLYTGYWIPTLTINGQSKFGRYSGVALETQHYPDSVHHPNFPSILLKKGELYHERTIFEFQLDNRVNYR